MNFTLSRAGRRWIALSMSVVATSAFCAAVPCQAQGLNPVLEWNLIAFNAAVDAGQNSVVQTRTFAMAQAAVHDALNAIDGRYELYVRASILPMAARRRSRSRPRHTMS